MEVLFGYLIKSALYTAIFYGVYWSFLRKETFYRFNRFFLLFGLTCSLVLPFITFEYDVVLQTAYSSSEAPVADAAMVSSGWMPLVAQFFCYTYFLVVCFLVLRQFFSLWKIKKMATKYGYVNYHGCRLITTATFESSFSVLNYIFLATPLATSTQEKKLILEHELAHIKQYHWVDLLFLQLYCALQWLNPFVWLYLKAIRENHEFLADQAVLANGNSPASYRAALINHSLKVPVFVFASPFLGNSRFVRLKMMYKPNSNPIKQYSVLLVLPLVLFVLVAFAEPEYVRVANQQQALVSETKGETAVIGYKTTKLNVKSKDVPVKVNANLSHVLVKPTAVPKTKPSVKTVGKNAELPIKDNAAPMLLVDGVESNISLKELNSADIEAIHVHKNDEAILKFGAKGRNGVIEVRLKKVQTNSLEVER